MLRLATGRHAFALVAGAATLAVFLVTIAIVTAAEPRRPYTRPTPPEAAGAFRDGGVPTFDAAIEDVLARELPRLFLESTDRSRRIAALREHPAFGRHGKALQTAWRHMLDTLDRWLDHHPTGRGYREITNELRARVEVVSDQLAAMRLGYYLEPAVFGGRRRQAIYTYRVDDVAFVRAGEDRARVLGLRRLDPIDDGVAVLGRLGEELDDPVVLLDEVDAKVEHQILPVLGGYAYPIGDDDWARSSTGRDVARAAGDAIRRELLTSLGSDAESLPLASARCRKLISASVRHHEAQHALDRDRDLPYPKALATALAEPARSELAVRARHELSAYLSQIASDVWLPQWTLWNLSRHAFRRSHERVAESYVAAVVIEGLARRLKIPSRGPVITRGAIDRERLAALVEPLAARSTVELRSAAAGLWAELYGERLPRIVD